MGSKFDINICPFTGWNLKPEDSYDNPLNTFSIIYKNPIILVVEMPHSVYVYIREKYLCKNSDYINKMHLYAGIIRQHYERYKKPFKVTRDFIDKDYKEYDVPEMFKQKAYYFLNYLYSNGGSEYKTFRLSSNDYSLSYATGVDEFNRILEMLEENVLINFIKGPIKNSAGFFMHAQIKLSINGIEKIEEDLPIAPMSGLIQQNVFTGDTRIDDKILLAKKLFFKQDSSFEEKRSACENLSSVLEPLRKKLESLFSEKDVSSFFTIVNKFDIRHNKERTKQLKYEEQLEWIFYTLLNTIVCYFKIINKN